MWSQQKSAALPVTFWQDMMSVPPVLAPVYPDGQLEESRRMELDVLLPHPGHASLSQLWSVIAPLMSSTPFARQRPFERQADLVPQQTLVSALGLHA